MKPLTTLAVLTAAGVVLAQSNTGSSNPLIPSNITTSCSSFLSTLDANATITACIQPIVNATSGFSPYNTGSTPSASSVNSVLKSLCSATFGSACSEAAIRMQLTSFYTACSNELNSSPPNKDVMRMYDVLFTLIPFKNAVCAMDDSGNYCVSKLSGSPAGSSSGSASSSASPWPSATPGYGTGTRIVKRGDDTTVTPALVPNTTAIGTSNLAFLYINTSMTESQLCTPCIRSVLTAYINFEQTTPYSRGIAQSPMLGNQPDIYNYVTKICGPNFLNGAVQAAGGLSSGLVNGAAPRAAVTDGVFTVAAVAVVGLAAML